MNRNQEPTQKFSGAYIIAPDIVMLKQLTTKYNKFAFMEAWFTLYCLC